MNFFDNFENFEFLDKEWANTEILSLLLRLDLYSFRGY